MSARLLQRLGCFHSDVDFSHLRDARAEVRQVFGDVVLPERVEAAPELGVLGEPVLLQVLLARVEQGLHLDLEVPRRWWVRGGGSEVAPNAERRRQPRQKARTEASGLADLLFLRRLLLARLADGEILSAILF